ncbi:hypothetical protein FZ025_19515 [Xanthomonas hyacinthi]|nr:hypothetical protein FZ025_19515 [Xanthomonas hyacinthi]
MAALQGLHAFVLQQPGAQGFRLRAWRAEHSRCRRRDGCSAGRAWRAALQGVQMRLCLRMRALQRFQLGIGIRELLRQRLGLRATAAEEDGLGKCVAIASRAAEFVFEPGERRTRLGDAGIRIRCRRRRSGRRRGSQRLAATVRGCQCVARGREVRLQFQQRGGNRVRLRIASLHLPDQFGTLLAELGDAVAKVAGSARQQRQPLARRLQRLCMRVFQFVGMAPGNAGREASIGVLQAGQQRCIQIRRGSGLLRGSVGLAHGGGAVRVVGRAGGGRIAKQFAMRQRRSAVQSQDRPCLAPGEGQRPPLVRAYRREWNRLVLRRLFQQCGRPGQGSVLRRDQVGFERGWIGSCQLVVRLPPCRGRGWMRDGFGHAR